MAVSVNYRIEGNERVSRGLQNLASEYRSEIDSVVRQWTGDEAGHLKRFGYPPQRRAAQPFKSDRQRRWFFWALRSGRISVPYQRSGRLASGWASKSMGWANYVLINSTAYAALVIGQDTQAGYHAGWWWIAENVIEQDVGSLVRELDTKLVGLARLS